ncbi:hypothetical protein NQ317_016085 [Molorchus minor]|uniref:Tyr recombinase domain-containing protein n=1 Tax=Molorchus minor TaxID=1323400 RepID=A0ABQ9IXA3_9CUCU|nr:hypothetical protein NQ317_016085 [Molorchus minor]
MNNCESEEIVEAANIAISNLLPTKSRSLYDIAYNRTGDGYQAKKSKILTKSEIDRFLSSADDKEFLMIKVGLILGIAGACRTDELVNLTVDDIEDFAASWQEYHGKISSVVASYLKLPDVACYTGHCLRRSSATLLADAGVDITTIKRHAGWKSTTVAEVMSRTPLKIRPKLLIRF